MDKAAAYTDLGESYFKGGKRAEAKKQVMLALEIAPGYERAQDLLLKLVDEVKSPRGGRAAARAVHADAGAAAARGRAAARRRADDRFAGLQWRFVRMKYHHKFESGRVQQDFYGEPWGIDAPAAEQNLSRRVKTATAIQVEDAILLTIDDKRLFEYPWIYFVEPSSMRLQPNEIPILREYFARGGSAMIDDFHGPAEWADFEQQMKLLFPDRNVGRGAEGSSGLQLLLQAGRLPAGRRASDRSSRAGRGSAAASRSICA